MTENPKQANQQKDISEVSLTRGLSHFVRVAGLLRCLRNARFLCVWRERVLSCQQRRCNKANQYHPTQQSPHENNWLPGNQNSHGRTSMDEERRTNCRYYTAEQPDTSMKTVLLGGDVLGRLGLRNFEVIAVSQVVQVMSGILPFVPKFSIAHWN